MSDIEPTIEDEPADGPAQLREALKRAEKRAAEAEEKGSTADKLARENAMLRAGVDLDSKLGQMFSRSYEGDLDPEAVKAEWSELAPAPAPREEPKPEETQQQTERAALASETVAPTQLSDVHPHRAGIEEFHRLRAEEGLNAQDAAVQFFDKTLTAAAAGDKRVIFDPEQWELEAKRS